jgi:hypothetical protein
VSSHSHVKLIVLTIPASPSVDNKLLSPTQHTQTSAMAPIAMMNARQVAVAKPRRSVVCAANSERKNVAAQILPAFAAAVLFSGAPGVLMCQCHLHHSCGSQSAVILRLQQRQCTSR